MNTYDPTIIEALKDYVIGSPSLSDEEKAQYQQALTDLSQGKVVDSESMAELDEFFDVEISRLEDQALRDNDADQISFLADLRNERLRLMSSMLSLNS